MLSSKIAPEKYIKNTLYLFGEFVMRLRSFDNVVPIDLHVIPATDIKKVDSRIIYGEKSQLIKYAGPPETKRRIYVPKTCYKEIIKKLDDNAIVLRINGNKTKAWQVYVDQEREVAKLETTKVKMDVKYDRKSGIYYEGPIPPSKIRLPSTETNSPPLKQTEKMLMRPLDAKRPVKKHLDEPAIQKERTSKRQKTTIKPVSDSAKRAVPLSNSQLSSKPSELKSSTSTGFFDKLIRIDLMLYSEKRDFKEVDFKKIDPRIKINLKDYAQAMAEIEGCFVASCNIYVPKNCYKEIIAKLNHQEGIFGIGKNKTQAWLNYLGQKANVETRGDSNAKRPKV